MKEITMMPVEYIGKTKQGNQIINSRREWTKKEIEWVNKMLSEGFSVEDLFEGVPTDTQINDLFWFDFDLICEWLNISDEDFSQRRKGA